MTNLLLNKNAIIYGGGGDLGGAVARTFAREGARVFLAGRTLEKLEAVAADIRSAGGLADAAVVDAIDEQAVEEHARSVVEQAGSIDVSICLIFRGDVQQTPLIDMSLADFQRAIDVATRSSFLTARAAARQMARQGSGAILWLTSGSGASHAAAPGMGSTGPADAVTEAFMRYLASEVGPSGVRVAGMYTAGVHGTVTREKMKAVTGGPAPDPEVIDQAIASMAMLRRTPRIEQVAETATFLASERAGAITGTVVNVTAGLVAG